mgnify:CR=1 FL=1|tara:strand:+ start:1546 stop:2124 length:579 start_codon:yes stop_codon:yes gene_type:complete
MFAVVKTGGKQYKVSPGDVLLVEKLQGEAGENVTLSDVLMVSDDKGATVGAPSVEKAEVKATIREQARGDKIIVFKKKRRQGYRRTAGHRQDLTVLTIDEIMLGGKSVAKSTTKAPAKKETASKPLAKAAKTEKESSKSSAVAEKKAPVKKATPTKKAATTSAEAAPKKAAPKKAAPKKTASPSKKKTDSKE